MFDFRRVIGGIVEEAVQKGEIAGANVLLLHGGAELYAKSFGYADKERGVPMSGDAIFRMFSMTKPVTAVAAMILAERGQIDLRDGIGKYIPEYSDLRVFMPDGRTEPAERQITVWDLLNMTSGLSYPGPDTLSSRAMERLFMELEAERAAGGRPDTVEICRRAAKVPLRFQPGEKWMYGLSADVLGGVVEVAAGRKFGAFLQEEIFGPLGMEDTGFTVPEGKRHRLAANYRWNPDKNELEPFRGRHLLLGDYSPDDGFESGGAGLVSTVGDYGRFAQMMLNGGTYGGVRILGRKTVELMTRNHLTQAQKADYNWDSVRGYGYGCLMRVLEDGGQAGSNAGAGEFGWDGWTGNYVTMDARENFALLYFIQRCDSGTTPEVRRLRMAAYAGLE